MLVLRLVITHDVVSRGGNRLGWAHGLLGCDLSFGAPVSDRFNIVEIGHCCCSARRRWSSASYMYTASGCAYVRRLRLRVPQ